MDGISQDNGVYSIWNHNLMNELSSVKFLVLKFEQKW